MKNNPSLRGLLIAIIAVAISFGIYFLLLSKKNYFLVDNPTSKTYYFRINNGDEKIISAGQFVKVEMEKGKNSIKVFDNKKNEIFDSAFQVTKDRGLLNITLHDYYIHTQYYGYDIKKDSLLLNLEKTIIDGKPYLGNPKLSNRLYTEDFYYNIDENYDQLIKNIQKTESRTKIFRKQDFLNFYKENYQ